MNILPTTTKKQKQLLLIALTKKKHFINLCTSLRFLHLMRLMIVYDIFT